ncbi:MAG: tetratricopeptide repeat protein [Nitrospiraceae bacterium]|nr:tetratricopeptide repeat protein [Nitrospiraceae bacterium]
MEAIGKILEASLQHYEKKEYAAAEKLIDELLAANPDFHRGWFMKGIILEETGRSSEAGQYLDKAGSVFTLMFRLAMQLEDIDPERSLSYYNRLVQMDPANNLLWFNRGLLCEKTGNTAEARASYGNLRPLREIASRILVPLGFMVIMIAGGIAMMKRGDRALASIVLASAIFCFFWLKRDAGKALQMISKKRKHG